MGLLEIIITAVGLSMDALAVAICKGACMHQGSWKESLLIALFFGAFQALMPLLGWALGSGFHQYISDYDHYVAVVLLGFIGIKLIIGAVKSSEGVLECKPLLLSELLMLSIATSIDAMAAGIAFSVLDIKIWLAIVLIGLITCALSFLGTLVGRRFGTRYQAKAQWVGGVALVLLGIKILVEHLSA
jgi:putative Mn2+ efflux pump MntP